MRTPPPIVIELDEEPLGIAVPEEGERVVFHAVHPALTGLHGHTFADATAAGHRAVAVFREAA
ncbi:hypothetical protein HHL28_07935 [Aerophototrophica crusticola]|uniref:Uncharacterized protein n=1 Tax=Aerophototrophica crusticola TaxID=1709002 RepID=A0A858R7M1_9PROT|nr:hypothetical protein HHL28_07935 [Rhodospirillaceae bacterium B3]